MIIIYIYKTFYTASHNGQIVFKHTLQRVMSTGWARAVDDDDVETAALHRCQYTVYAFLYRCQELSRQ